MQDADSTSVVGHVGRKGLRFALTDGHGGVKPGTMRHYDVEAGSSVSGSLSSFRRDTGLDHLPRRLAIAVAGLARGDAISITQTRWFVSRSGLQSMLGAPPLILNDFEAEAWALTGHGGAQTPIAGAPPVNLREPGTYCIAGITSGLGVSVMTRDRAGGVHVLATEAGHAGFAPGSRRMAELVATMFPNTHPIAAEDLISAGGLVAIYNALAGQQHSSKRMTRPEDITRHAASDPLARAACEMLCEAFWTHIGNLVLSYGAWDGVIVTGGLAMALRDTLGGPRMQACLAGTGKYARLVAAMPRMLVAVEHGELLGAAKALQRQAA
ncbi:glucokinase [Sphingomonas metalli]|uniref:Glucokinase n=1 Tax=Sphingomonas metalli TaxID=1779358 RepID=A0A916WX93_9SPHN|nr:glucokinase [Sphingomonas metalli]GGB37102.1 glucokinase [Sphingomonas metalli]